MASNFLCSSITCSCFLRYPSYLISSNAVNKEAGDASKVTSLYNSLDSNSVLLIKSSNLIPLHGSAKPFSSKSCLISSCLIVVVLAKSLIFYTSSFLFSIVSYLYLDARPTLYPNSVNLKSASSCLSFILCSALAVIIL